MNHYFKEIKPKKPLEKYIDVIWFFENLWEEIQSPIVPDWCCDIIYDLWENEIFVVWVMDICDVKIFNWNKKFAWIRFKPWVLSYILKTDFKLLLNKQILLNEIDKELFDFFNIENLNFENFEWIIQEKLEKIFSKNIFDDKLLEIINFLKENKSVNELQSNFFMSQKTIERLFYKRIWVSPKKFLSMIRFYETHKNMWNEKFKNITKIAINSWYYDQAHFNHEYKKFAGFSPKKMSNFYN